MEKLVRDKYPDIIKWKWEECSYYIASVEDKINKLLEKISEEAEEVKNSNSNIELQSEIWDLLDVIDELCNIKWFSIEDIHKLRKLKTQKKWWFKKWVILTIDEKYL